MGPIWLLLVLCAWMINEKLPILYGANLHIHLNVKQKRCSCYCIYWSTLSTHKNKPYFQLHIYKNLFEFHCILFLLFLKGCHAPLYKFSFASKIKLNAINRSGWDITLSFVFKQKHAGHLVTGNWIQSKQCGSKTEDKNVNEMLFYLRFNGVPHVNSSLPGPVVAARRVCLMEFKQDNRTVGDLMGLGRHCWVWPVSPGHWTLTTSSQP